jgi:hypothetical protein
LLRRYATRRTAPVNVTATIGKLPKVWYAFDREVQTPTRLEICPSVA